MAEEKRRVTKVLKDGKTKVSVPTGHDAPDGAGGHRWVPYTEEEIQELVDQHQALADKKAAEAEKVEQAKRDRYDNNAREVVAAQQRTSGQNPQATAQSVAAEQKTGTPTSGYNPSTVAPQDDKSDPFANFDLSSTVHISDTIKPATGRTDTTPGGGRETKASLGRIASGKPNVTPQSKTVEESLTEWVNKTPEEIKALQQKLKDAGGKVDVNGIFDPDTQAAYASLLKTAAQYQHSGNDLTPDEILDSLAAAGKKAAEKDRHKTSTDTNRSVSLTDPQTAKATIEDAMTAKLGRRPTANETTQFINALNSYEQTNPTTTSQTTVSDTDENGNVVNSSNSSSTGSSPSPSSFAQNYLQSNHGPEMQAINHLNWYNVALQALTNSPVSTGLPT